MDARFSLDARGQLTPDGPDGQYQLGARAGRFVLAPTHDDVVLLIRSPVAGRPAAKPRVVLAGDAAAFPLSDLIAFLGQSRWSGVIRVHAPGGERSVLLKDGEVRGATSDDPADRIGEVIVRMGYLTRERLEQALVENPPSRVGRALVERGVLQAHDLWKCLTVQVSEIFHAIILAKEGTFLLLDQDFDDKTVHTLNLSMHTLLMDSIRKIDELAHFRKRIPHGRLYVMRKRPSDGTLERVEDQVLSLASGERTVLELAQAAKLTEFDATRAVYRLLEGGYAQVSEKKSPATPDAPKPEAPRAPETESADGRAAEIARAFGRIFREIRDEVARQGKHEQFIAAANAALETQALSSSPVLEGIRFDRDGFLPEQALLAQFFRVRGQLGSAPEASLKQALSDVMFFLLFQAGEQLASGADEELARRVKALLAAVDQE